MFWPEVKLLINDSFVFPFGSDSLSPLHQWINPTRTWMVCTLESLRSFVCLKIKTSIYRRHCKCPTPVLQHSLFPCMSAWICNFFLSEGFLCSMDMVDPGWPVSLLSPSIPQPTTDEKCRALSPFGRIILKQWIPEFALGNLLDGVPYLIPSFSSLLPNLSWNYPINKVLALESLCQGLLLGVPKLRQFVIQL